MGSNTSFGRSISNLVFSAVPGAGNVPFALRYAVYRRYFYSSKFNFAYLRIPKSANSTVVMTLCSAVAEKQGKSLILDDGYEGSRIAKQMSKAGFQTFVMRQFSPFKPYRFTFVRNPLSRILSCYLDKIASPQQVYRNDLGMGMGPVSFCEFLERLNNGYLTTNAHWAPQSALIASKGFDFIGYVEHLDRDLKKVISRVIGIEDFQTVSKDAGRRNTRVAMEEYYGDAERQLVRKLYTADFERFYPQDA
jgi:Sulfotransferase family